jgi:hypothetical protein
MMDACFCNRDRRQQCCVAECKTPSSGENGCYPCHCSRGAERCLHTGQLKADRQKGRP